MYSYKYSCMHTISSYTAHLNRPQLAWPSFVSHLDLPRSLHWLHGRMTPCSRLHQNYSATAIYPTWEKRSTKSTNEWQTVNWATNSSMTTKYGKRSNFSPVRFCTLTSHVCQYSLWMRWRWRRIPNSFPCSLHDVASSGQHVVPQQLKLTEYRLKSPRNMTF